MHRNRGHSTFILLCFMLQLIEAIESHMCEQAIALNSVFNRKLLGQSMAPQRLNEDTIKTIDTSNKYTESKNVYLSLEHFYVPWTR